MIIIWVNYSCSISPDDVYMTLLSKNWLDFQVSFRSSVIRSIYLLDLILSFVTKN